MIKAPPLVVAFRPRPFRLLNKGGELQKCPPRSHSLVGASGETIFNVELFKRAPSPSSEGIESLEGNEAYLLRKSGMLRVTI